MNREKVEKHLNEWITIKLHDGSILTGSLIVSPDKPRYFRLGRYEFLPSHARKIEGKGGKVEGLKQ